MLSHAMAKRVEHRLLDKLISDAKNPRRPSDAQIAQLAQSRGVPVNQAVIPKQPDARRIRHNAPTCFYGRLKKAS
jgi:hypothetical protein